MPPAIALALKLPCRDDETFCCFDIHRGRGTVLAPTIYQPFSSFESFIAYTGQLFAIDTLLSAAYNVKTMLRRRCDGITQ